MRLDSFPHGTEEYFCQSCNSYTTKNEVKESWKCPECGNYIEIRVKTEKLDNSCFRIPIGELEIGDIVLMERSDKFREVLGVSDSFKNNQDLFIGLKEYGSITAPKKNKILKLHGAWCH